MYEAFFGLTGKPFQLNPDPSFYFGSRGHKRAFAYLEYGLYQSEGFIVITGEIGAEAQNLAPRAVEELRMLSNFQLGDQALLQSFLVGQPELRTMMQSEQMQQLRSEEHTSELQSRVDISYAV